MLLAATIANEVVSWPFPYLGRALFTIVMVRYDCRKLLWVDETFRSPERNRLCTPSLLSIYSSFLIYKAAPEFGSTICSSHFPPVLFSLLTIVVRLDPTSIRGTCSTTCSLSVVAPWV